MNERELRDFRELQVWQKSRHLMLAIFNATETFAEESSYELASLIRHDCLAIAANIAKGYDKLTNAVISDFFEIAMSAANDLQYHLLAAQSRGLLNGPSYQQLAHELTAVKRMLTSI